MITPTTSFENWAQWAAHHTLVTDDYCIERDQPTTPARDWPR